MHGRMGRMTRRRKWLALRIVLIVVAALLLVSASAALWLYHLWNAADTFDPSHMFVQESSPAPVFQREGETPAPKPAALIDRPTVYHDGKHYALREGGINVLFMGVDTTDEEQFVNTMISGHQADTLILVRIDTDTREMTFLNIPRNTLANVRRYDPALNYIDTEKLPICLQYAYGDAGKFSCEITMGAVEELLFGIPIDNYVSMNMDGMIRANDGIGGVTLTLLDNFDWVNPEMVKGREYTLLGREAMYYIKGRIESGLEDNTNLSRMKRQTQYYKAFFSAAKEKLKGDPLYALELYSQMGKSVWTDLSVNEITYLVRLVMNMKLDDDRIMTLPGEADPETDDFTVDDEALKELLLSVFFEEVA